MELRCRICRVFLYKVLRKNIPHCLYFKTRTLWRIVSTGVLVIWGSFHAHLTRGFNHFVATQFQGVSEAAKRFCSADLQPASGIIAKLIAEERKVQLFASDLSTFELARLHGEKRC